jgi:hypothetical protein
MIDTERILYGGTTGTQRVRVWLEPRGGGIGLFSHDIGSGLESAFGKSEIETFLEVDAQHMPNLTAALRAERPGSADASTAMDMLTEKYRGNAAATSAFRAWLSKRGIPYRFTIV